MAGCHIRSNIVDLGQSHFSFTAVNDSHIVVCFVWYCLKKWLIIFKSLWNYKLRELHLISTGNVTNSISLHNTSLLRQICVCVYRLSKCQRSFPCLSHLNLSELSKQLLLNERNKPIRHSVQQNYQKKISVSFKYAKTGQTLFFLWF